MAFRRRLHWISLLGLGALACGATPTDDDLASASSPIIGGTLANVCEWPTTVMLPGCSGTLVHPRVVITAKHCLSGTPSSIQFGELRTQVTKTVRVAQCYRHPQTDFGFCTLAEDVTGMPLVPVMAPCEMSELKMGAPIVEAGFGREYGTGTGRSGRKKWIAGTVVRGSATRTTVDVTAGTQDGEYFGDSGGPLYLKMPDGTWRLIGGDWTSPDWIDSNQPRVSTYTSVPYHVAWAEQQSGIDLTPCHDATGWNAGPNCVGSPTNPGEGTGTWANSCAGQTLLVSPTCGANSDAGRIVVDAASDSSRADVASDAVRDVGTSSDASRSDARPTESDGSTADANAPDAGPEGRDAAGTSSGSAGTGGGGASAAGGGVGSGSAGAGSVGAGGTSNGGTLGGGGSSAGTAGPGASHSSAEAGCSCRTASRRPPAPTLWLLALACAALARLKGRRPRGSDGGRATSASP